MARKLSKSIIMNALEWSYEKAISQPFPGIESAFTLAESYSKENWTLEEKIDSLIRWQFSKATAFGFATGLGGIVTIPVAVPANIAGVLFVQVRMVASIALLCGYDVHDSRVKTMIFACICGSAGSDILKKAGIEFGTKMLHQVLNKLSQETINRINNAVVVKLLSQFSKFGLMKAGKAVPFVGAAVSGVVDGVTTNIIGNIAKKAFFENSIKK